MNCGIYIRVSTAEQAREGYSLAAQKKRLMAFAESQGWDVVGFYPDDGRSAKDMNRPELQRMIHDIRSGLVNVVLVYKLDRLTRSVLDLYELLKIFEKNNCKFKSATEVYDTTTAIGRMFITLVATFAQFERENLGERVRFGMREKVSQGEWHGSTPPFGFDYDMKKKELVINDKEADIVKKMYDLYINSGLSDRKIAIELNNLGYHTKKNQLWSEAKIRQILNNPINIGRFRWGVRKNKNDYFESAGAPKIIDNQEFELAKKIRSSRRAFHGRQATSDYFFSGILQCARCGARMKGTASIKKGIKYKNYRCRNWLYHQCNMPGISERVMEKVFLRYIKAYVHFDIEKQAVEEIASSKDKNDRMKEIRKLRHKIESISRRRKKWQYAWANDLLTQEDFISRMKEETESEQNVQGKLRTLSNGHNNSLTADQIKDMMDYIENWHRLSDHEKKQFMQIQFKNIVVDQVDAKHLIDRIKIKKIEFN